MRLTLFVGFMSIATCVAQSNMKIESYDPVPAEQVAKALGTNITDSSEWQYRAAQSAHMTWARFDCPWQSVELQRLPTNTSSGYTLPKDCAAGLNYGKRYGVHNIVNALYGAPYERVSTAVTLEDLPAGSTEMTLRFTDGSLAAVIPGQSYVAYGRSPISRKHAYAGTLISAKSANSITLASALTTNIPRGSSITINLQLYPPVLIPQGTNYLANGSLQAYGSYVHYLQMQISALAFEGRVSIWNEPPWEGDPWDEAGNLYDKPPQEGRITSDTGLETAMYVSRLPAMVSAKLDNGYTNKSGSGSLFVTDGRSVLFSRANIYKNFASESFHPYGNNPEDSAWLPRCIPLHASSSTRGNVGLDCTPDGMVTGSNIKWQATFYATARSVNEKVPDLSITETGLCRCSSNPSEEQITRFNLRQFLVFSGLGVHPILFYRLAGDPQFEWLHSDQSPYPVYTAFQNLMAKIVLIAHPQIHDDEGCRIPRITSYVGTYPLAAVTLVGSQNDQKTNSFLVYVWQRSYTSGRWVSLASPAKAPLAMQVPSELTVTSVRDTVTSAHLQFAFREQRLTFSVADNPVEVLLTPIPSHTIHPPCS